MDILISFAAQWAVVLALIVALMLARQVRVYWGWLFASILIFCLLLAAIFWLGPLIPLESIFGELHWNWAGKVASILTTILVLCCLWYIAKKPLSASGITLAVRQGAWAPAIVVTLVLIALSVGVEIWAHDGTDTGAERLLFQATMPGLEEEPFWRGTMLLAMNEALRGNRLKLGGAEVSWGGLLVTLLFASGHGVQYADGAFAISWLIVGFTGVIGFGLYWLRERTGSVMIPIIAHNLINVSNSFF